MELQQKIYESFYKRRFICSNFARTLAGVLEASCYVLEALSRIPLCSTYLEALLFDFILKYIILQIQVPHATFPPLPPSAIRHPPMSLTVPSRHSWPHV